MSKGRRRKEPAKPRGSEDNARYMDLMWTTDGDEERMRGERGVGEVFIQKKT